MFSEMFPNSISYNKYAVLFTLTSLVIANFGLEAIIQLSLPVLMFLYPLAIVLILLSLATPVLRKQKAVYQWTIGFTLVAAIFDFLNAVPDSVKANSIIQQLLKFAKNFLPAFEYGFGWIIPSLIGLGIGIAIWKYQEKRFI